MKHGVLATTLSALMFALTAHAITVDGHVFLSGQTDHTGTLIMFRAVSPSARTDSTHSFNTGYFTLSLQPGVYDMEFSNDGYVSYGYEDVALLFNTMLATETLMPPVPDPLGATLGPGQFDVTDTIHIGDQQHVQIVPGTQLFFRPGIPMIVQGWLEAMGTEADSIVFTWRVPTEAGRWGGLQFSGASASPSRMEYCVVSGAGFGISCTSCSPIVRQCSVRGNRGSGGVILWASDARLESCAIVENSSTYGGGVGCWQGNPTITNCVLRSNSATYKGGGLFCGWLSQVEMASCSVQSCYAYDDGGGICVSDSGCLTATGCVVKDNMCGNPFGYSPGVHVEWYGRVVLQNCLVVSNGGDWSSGAGLASHDGELRLICTTVVGNRASHYATWAPAIYASGGVLEVNSCAVVATEGTGLIAGYYSAASIIYNCLYSPQEVAFSGTRPTGLGIVALTNANGDSCDTYYNILLDPQFVDTGAGNYHLTVGSPCIDAGDPSLPDDPDGTVADMGAFYFNQLAVPGSGRIAMRPYALAQNYPNPFNAQTRIAFDLARAGEVTLEVFDITGRLLQRLVDGRMTEGTHEVQFDARDLPSGVYVYRLAAGEVIEAKKMILIR